ncbi:MAG: hypothetical protein H7Z13_09315 [Ferruginibacter sp.]|nr:hypothetical protein [Ferruginibacter sp.]
MINYCLHTIKNYLLLPCVLLFNFSFAQNYQAINGSPYAGSLAVGNNPASIVHVPYAWDITPFSIQLKQSTNAFKIEKYALLSSPGNAEIASQNGIKKRFVFANQDIRLMNTRISLNAKAAIAFGANLRNYVYATTSEFNAQDTVFELEDFMKNNINHLPLSGEFSGSGWAELYATYAQTIIDDGDRLLNGGITIKVNRALVGGYAKAQGLNYIPGLTPTGPGYLLTNGSLQYGYSYNFDAIDSNKTAAANRNAFFKQSFSSLSADIGFEYILLTSEDKEEGGDYAYETKIGISLMDIGVNKYRHGSRSRLAIAGLAGISDTLMENKFSSVGTFDDFNDSLAGIVSSFSRTVGEFFIYQPCRVMINIDQHIISNIFINGEITIPVLPLVAKNSLHIRDMNLLAITPRWELKSMGIYLPVLLNTRNQLWVGGAFKAGPVLMGTHNLANLFSKNKSQTGGLYLALTIRPGKKYDRQEHYPKGKLQRKQGRGLECPKF